MTPEMLRVLDAEVARQRELNPDLSIGRSNILRGIVRRALLGSLAPTDAPPVPASMEPDVVPTPAKRAPIRRATSKRLREHGVAGKAAASLDVPELDATAKAAAARVALEAAYDAVDDARAAHKAAIESAERVEQEERERNTINGVTTSPVRCGSDPLYDAVDEAYSTLCEAEDAAKRAAQTANYLARLASGADSATSKASNSTPI